MGLHGNPQEIVIDYETFFDSSGAATGANGGTGTKYSLRSMSTVEYVMSPLFKAHGASVKIGATPAVWITGDKLPTLFARLDPANTVIVGHNLAFDGMITEWRYGFKPARYIDTLGMSRFVHGASLKSHSLDSVVERITGTAGKLKAAALAAVNGVRDPDPALLHQLGLYAIDDAEETYMIRHAMAKSFPAGEYHALDWTIKMLLRPQLKLDREVLEHVRQDEIQSKQEYCDALGVTQTMLRSANQLATLLRARGVEPPVKTSERTGKLSFDFSKSSKAFAALGSHDDPVVRTLYEGRVANASSINETRAVTYMKMHDMLGGYMPVPLNYCGAQQTNRLSAAGMGMNVQNMGRKSLLRKAVIAPKGYVVLAADLSNIELRVNMQQCREYGAVQDLRDGVDLYCKFASALYNRPVSKSDEAERQIGKVAELSLGYGAGGPTFRNMLWAQSKRDESEAFCNDVVTLYRSTKPNWQRTMWSIRDTLKVMAAGGTPPQGVVDAPVEWHTDGIALPSGFKIKYPNLRYVRETDEDGGVGEPIMVYERRGRDRPKGYEKLWHGTVAENLGQGLAACVISDVMTRVYADSGVMPVMQVHDELVYVIPENTADQFKALVLGHMAKSPAFWPELPTKGEVGYGPTYADAK